jgi:selenocysteine insertion sequence-binding protein 2
MSKEANNKPTDRQEKRPSTTQSRRKKPSKVEFGDFIDASLKAKNQSKKKSLQKVVSKSNQSNQKKASTPSTATSYTNAAIEHTEDARIKGRRRRRKKRPSKIRSTLTRYERSLGINHQVSTSSSTQFLIHHLVNAEEVEEDDEYDEILEETRIQLKAFGPLKELQIHRDDQEMLSVAQGDVLVTFELREHALIAFEALHTKTFGGNQVLCEWIQQSEPVKICLRGMIDPTELNDPDEYTDVYEEILQYFKQYKDAIDDIKLDKLTGDITLICQQQQKEKASKIVQEMNGKIYGGSKVTSELFFPIATQRIASLSTTSIKLVQEIPMLEENEELKALTAALLQRLMSLQQRVHQQNPLHAKRLRRVVCGFHEVKRGLEGNKLLLLFVASDIKQCEIEGGLDDKTKQILTLAILNEVPLICYPSLKRKKLGYLLQKSIRVSCAGIYSIDGANETYKQIIQKLQQISPRSIINTKP